MPRDTWNTRIGYILAMVGSAVGLGNIIRFPFVTSEHGGAAFVAIYLVAVFLIGIPMLLAELMLGRRSRRNVVDTFLDLGGKAWKPLGLFFVLVVVFVMGWYSVIGGWTLIYVVEGFSPTFWDDPAGYFFTVSEGYKALGFHALFIGLTIGIVGLGVSRGIEPAVTVLLPLLAVMLLGLAVYSLTLPDATDGIRFYLAPDFGEVRGGTFVAAAGQAFFSMSIGFGTLITYASYMKRDSSLSEDGVAVGLADTGIALLGGFVVFPLLAAFALLGTPAAADGGIGVAFLALPVAFATIGGSLGIVLGLVFFGLLFVAAVSSSISLLEVGVSWITDQGIPRWRAVAILGAVMFLLGIPMALSGALLDFASGALTDVLILGGSFFVALFLGWFYQKRMNEDPVEEMNRGSGRFRLGTWSIYIIRFVMPVVLLALLGIAMLDFVEALR